MPSNADVIGEFLRGRRACTRTMQSDGVKLLSYMVPIARRDGAAVQLLELARPTDTNKRHVLLLKTMCRVAGVTARQP